MFVIAVFIFFCCGLDIWVLEVVNSDGRQAGYLDHPFDLMQQITLGKIKQAFIWIRLIEGLKVLYCLIIQEPGDCDAADTGIRFWREDIFGSFHHLIVFIDVQPVFIGPSADKVIPDKSQQLPPRGSRTRTGY